MTTQGDHYCQKLPSWLSMFPNVSAIPTGLWDCSTIIVELNNELRSGVMNAVKNRR